MNDKTRCFPRTLLGILLSLPLILNAVDTSAPCESAGVRIGNYLCEAPYGIAWIVNDSAAFVMNPDPGYNAHAFTPGAAAPNGSYHLSTIKRDGAQIVLEWGRVGDAVVGRISCAKKTSLEFALSGGWPNWKSAFTPTAEGATGTAQVGGKPVIWKLRTAPAPAASSEKSVRVTVTPEAPIRFVAGLGDLPDLASVGQTLDATAKTYAAHRPQASGDWGDFVGAIADNVNNSRVYASDNHLLAHTVSRGWNKTPNHIVYFCWDSFLTANLAAIDDPVTARDTVRGILSSQTPEGLVPNVGHSSLTDMSTDRSQPPVGSWCVWKMHQRYLNDQAFLAEVYPKLVLWHEWWPKYRNAKGDGLLEWGSQTGKFQDAQYETGWDDNLCFQNASMVGTTMNCYAVDLSAMWSQDAHYLALIADTLGKTDDAQRFRQDEANMNRRINEKLWNPELKAYCSRFWNDAKAFLPVPASAFGAGFDGECFSDDKLQVSVGTVHAALPSLEFATSPQLKIPDQARWSVRWKGTLIAPETTTYRLTAWADKSVKVLLDGKTVLFSESKALPRVGVTKELTLQAGQRVSVVWESVQAFPPQSHQGTMKLEVERLAPTEGQFLTRLSPMNFYPLSAGTPDAERTKAVMSMVTDPQKFWGAYLLPTLAYNDPSWRIQNYWKGKVWGPVNYIVWDGIKRHAAPSHTAEFADRSVKLFMSNWTRSGVCGENYLSTNGAQSSDPHYTWGALLCLIGLESIVDVDDDGQVVLNGTGMKTLDLKNIPLLGKTYDVKAAPGSAILLRDGKVVLEAKGAIIKDRVP